MEGIAEVKRIGFMRYYIKFPDGKEDVQSGVSVSRLKEFFVGYKVKVIK